jgi:hypothetical protein
MRQRGFILLATVYPGFFCSFQDSTPDVKNRTLIIDNGGRSLGYMMTNHSQYANDAGRTWLVENSTSQFEDVRLLGNAHFGLHPTLTM